jgi:hypothetical protein
MKMRVFAAMIVAASFCTLSAAHAEPGVAAPASTDTAAQSASPPVAAPDAVSPTPEPAAAPTGPAIAPAGMLVAVRVTQDMSSNKSHVGDRFSFVLHNDIVVNGQVLIPAGTPGVGEVIDAAPGGMAGKGGKLVLAARYLEFNGQQVALRTLRLSGGGADRNELVMGLSMAGGIGGSVAAMFIPGGEVLVPVGTVAEAKLTNAFPAVPTPVAASAPSEQAAPAEPATAPTSAPQAPGA